MLFALSKRKCIYVFFCQQEKCLSLRYIKFDTYEGKCIQYSPSKIVSSEAKMYWVQKKIGQLMHYCS